MALCRCLRKCRKSVPIYVKYPLCILGIYFFNLYFGFRSNYWMEKSFENEYHLKMKHLDAVKMMKNAEKYYGRATNLLSTQFLIKNEYLCGRSLDPEAKIFPHLLIFVKSFVRNREEREAIRLTWGNPTRLERKKIKLAFVIGKDLNNRSIEEESKIYGDLIQIDQMDSYYYSSHKMLLMLRWIDEYCSSKSVRSPHRDLRHYVLFVDDDFYLNDQILEEYLSKIDSDREMTTYERRTFATGDLIENARPKRLYNDPFFVSFVDYPYDRYPSYLSSECFLLTRYNARLFYFASKYTRIFPFDEIYLGLLAYSMSIQFISNSQLFITSNSLLKKESHLNSSICLHGFKNEKLIQFWNEIHHQTDSKH